MHIVNVTLPQKNDTTSSSELSQCFPLLLHHPGREWESSLNPEQPLYIPHTSPGWDCREAVKRFDQSPVNYYCCSRGTQQKGKKESRHFIFPELWVTGVTRLSCMSGASVFNHRGGPLSYFFFSHLIAYSHGSTDQSASFLSDRLSQLTNGRLKICLLDPSVITQLLLPELLCPTHEVWS